ncbi:acyltransferase [Priestia aryabhattai]|uniref:acyltransferase n=1 Tax=Priestia aryabhattai TaxID=412384 RepID=UPI00366A5D45
MNPLLRIRNLYNYIHNKLIIKKHKVDVEKNLKINGIIHIDNKGSMNVGQNVRINSGKNYNIIGGDTRTSLIALNKAVIKIGSETGMSNTTIVAKKEVIIGPRVMIGGSVKIYDNDFHSVDFIERMKQPDQGIISKSVIIEEGVFVGSHSIILKGVTIGKFSVIGAGSVVTKSIPPRQVWGGNPAKFIRNI